MNNDGDTALHVACRTGNLELITLVLKFDNNVYLQSKTLIDTKINMNAKNSSGDTPLHVACRTGNHKLGKLLILRMCDINVRDAHGNTPLHLACNFGILKLCEQLLQMNCDINAKNDNGETPLLVACKHCQFGVIKLLINEPHIQINVTNHAGDTLLHVLCQSSSCSSRVVLYILEVTQCDPNVSNAAGKTPLQLTSNPNIVRELIRFGANPTDVYKSSIQLGTKHPPQPVMKVYVVGNPSAGKSTLTAALQKESSRLVKVFIPAKKVSAVEEKTAGIIPYEFDSKKYGQVTLYDFAGHREFYGSHAALLQNSIDLSPPIFLLVVDLRESYEDVKQNILYWLSFLENQCISVSEKPHVIIVGSHADILKSCGENYDEKEGIIEHIRASSHSSSMELVGFVAMNCQYS